MYFRLTIIEGYSCQVAYVDGSYDYELMDLWIVFVDGSCDYELRTCEL